jgi:predicted metalloprotease with PDZ domain
MIKSVSGVLWSGAEKTMESTTGTPQASETASLGKAIYTVKFSEKSYRRAKISARIPMHGETILMYPEGAENFPRQWATFVRDLSVKLPNGKSYNPQYVGNAQWKITPPRPQYVDLDYEVVIEHDLSPAKWKFGYKQAAFARPNYVFSSGKALFIGTYELDDIMVQFDVPPNWRVHTGWNPLPEKPNTFLLKGVTELTEVAIVVGQPLERLVAVDDLEVTFAVGNEMANSLDLMAANSHRFIMVAKKFFADAPSSGMLIIADFDPAYVGGGEAFTHSICLVFSQPPMENNKASWEHIINHEILHLWIGNSIRFSEQHQEYWFNEGFTDYVTNMLERNLGYVNDDEFLERLAGHYQKYLGHAGHISPSEAGNDKAGHYDLVYSGGLIIAFALDMELCKLTRFEKGIRELLREMYVQFGTTGSRFTSNDIANLAAKITGSDLNEFFKRYVHGTELIPLELYASLIGVAVQRGLTDGKHQVRLTREHADSEKVAHYRKWIGLPPETKT